MGIDWRSLVVTTVMEPAAAARQILSLRLDRPLLWTALALVSALNAILITLSDALSPSPNPFPSLFGNPLLLASVVFVVLFATALLMAVSGQWLGGSAGTFDVLALVIWLQALRILVQVLSLVFLVVMPGLFVVLIFAAFILGIYILLNFINEAHGFGSIMKSAAVLVLTILGMVLAVSFLAALFLGPELEAASRV